MLNSAWIRLATGQFVRADRILSVRTERAEGPPQGRWADTGIVRIMICLDFTEADTEDGISPPWWQEAAVCHRERSDFLLANLLNLMAAVAETSGVRFIYPVLSDGRVHRWIAGVTLPPGEEAAVTGLPAVPHEEAARV
ncbi:hypothetical protein [Streptomyces ureilyticus]|uniref:Uncharacterized protein n=1 Tax=Streptomyces ureilyticus TaxID=1775131 RepID=A0ABX0DNA5_9ACTN|nr:hypothetical protein [Streptomyces ureilyticus]NGO40636.1 hypothetical protein [Streptomyces ureilyticus]